MTVQAHFDAGRLSEAVAAQTEQVKQSPTDLDRRMLLCELLCFAGDLDRADRHLETMSKQDQAAIPGVSLLRQLIRAEHHRRQFFDEGRVPELMHDPTEDIRLRLQASIAIREHHWEEAAEHLANANEHAGFPMMVNGSDAENFRDLDDLTANVFEVFTPTGKYYWIPMKEVESIELRTPQRPLDLLWRPAGMTVCNGPDGEIFLPVLYHGSHAADDEHLRLGRLTDWLEQSGVARGIGQRMFLLGEDTAGLLELNTLAIMAEVVE